MKKLYTSKMTAMKRFLAIFSLAAVMVACNSDADRIAAENAKLQRYQDSLRLSADTAGLAEYQAWKAQNELVMEDEQISNTPPVVARSTRSSAARSTSARRSSSGTRSSGAVASGGTATQKKGWSKAAKGAVIGGVAGGAAGAVINKKNRVAGGVIGAVLGAGGGYVIGRQMDKKDGRQ